MATIRLNKADKEKIIYYLLVNSGKFKKLKELQEKFKKRLASEIEKIYTERYSDALEKVKDLINEEYRETIYLSNKHHISIAIFRMLGLKPHVDSISGVMAIGSINHRYTKRYEKATNSKMFIDVEIHKNKKIYTTNKINDNIKNELYKNTKLAKWVKTQIDIADKMEDELINFVKATRATIMSYTSYNKLLKDFPEIEKILIKLELYKYAGVKPFLPAVINKEVNETIKIVSQNTKLNKEVTKE